MMVTTIYKIIRDHQVWRISTS